MTRRLRISVLVLVFSVGASASAAGDRSSLPSLDRYQTSEREFSRALAADRAGDVASAKRGYLSALADDPEFVEAMANLARIESNSGNAEQARAWADRALGAKPEYPNAHAVSGLISLRAGAFARAIDELRTARALSPRDTDVLTNLGAALMQRGQWAEARSALDNAVRLDPQSPNALFNLALVSDLLGDSAGAAHFYREFLAIADQDTPEISGVKERLDALADASGGSSPLELGSGLASSSP